jgi:threonine aldolase
VINLYSDTQTQPTEGMRRAIATADVADEQRGADPTTNRLQDRVAELLGHEAALFLPSGTMCNQISLRLHARPGGDELILDRTAHPIIAEAGGPASNAGLMIHALDGDRGVFSADQLRAAIRPRSRYFPRSRIVSVEQTTNMGGGRVWPLEAVWAVIEAARAHGLRTHLDGARLMNAVVASGVSAAEYAGGFDTAWIDFTKGLGAPVGAVLCASRELIAEAWRWKQQMGGAFRQSGIVAAGCLYALDHHVERLAEDHENARVLAQGLAELGCEVVAPDTNIVIFAPPGGAGESMDDAAAGGFVEAMERRGVELSGTPDGRARAVTHLDVDRSAVEEALRAARDVLLA